MLFLDRVKVLLIALALMVVVVLVITVGSSDRAVNEDVVIGEEFTMFGPSGQELRAVEINKAIYYLPSESHLQRDEGKQELYTFADLRNLTYDEELQLHVHYFKNLKVGDKILFSDTIQTISYDKHSNATYLGFLNERGTVTSWPFKSNLTDRFEVGQTIKLKFVVVEYPAGSSFETLDYIKYGLDNEGEAPDISKYLVK